MKEENYIEFLLMYVQLIKDYEEAKGKSGTEIELDTIDTYIEMYLNSVDVIVKALRNKVSKEEKL